jgi:MoaC family
MSMRYWPPPKPSFLTEGNGCAKFPPIFAVNPIPTRQVMKELSHLDEKGQVRMVDVTAKAPTLRRAVARGRVRMRPETAALIHEGGIPKGDVFATARIVGNGGGIVIRKRRSWSASITIRNDG